MCQGQGSTAQPFLQLAKFLPAPSPAADSCPLEPPPPCSFDQYAAAWDTSVTVNVDGEEVRFFHAVTKGVHRVFVDHPTFLAKVWGMTGEKLYGAKSGADYIDNQKRFSLFCKVRHCAMPRLQPCAAMAPWSSPAAGRLSPIPPACTRKRRLSIPSSAWHSFTGHSHHFLPASQRHLSQPAPGSDASYHT